MADDIHHEIPMDEVQVKIISTEFRERIVEGGFDVLGSMEFVPELTGEHQYARYSDGRVTCLGR